MYLEFYRAHQKEKATTTIGLISIDDPGEYGIAEIDAGYEIKRFKEKPGARRDLLQSCKYWNVYLQPGNF